MFRAARWKLTIWYAGIFVLVLAALGAAIYATVRHSLRSELDAGIRSVVDAWLLDPPALSDRRPLDLDREFEAETADVFLLVVRSDGALVANPSGIEAEDFVEHGAVEQALAGQRRWQTIREHGEEFRLLTAPIREDGAIAGAVIGGRSLEPLQGRLDLILGVLIGAGTAGAAVAMLAGYLFAGRALRPLVLAYERQREFVADASHELRSPLAVIRGAADLLLREPLSPSEREGVREIRDVTDEAARLIEDLLVLARQGTRPRADAPPADLAEAVGSAIDQMRPLLEAHGSAVTTRLSAALVSAEREEVRRAVRALLENVVAHTPAGTSVTVETDVAGRRALIRVADDGPGVDAAFLDRAFDRFARSDRARTPGSGAGAGLGLAIVRALAERRGGGARIRPRDGGGTVVEIELPLARAAERRRTGEMRGGELPGR